MAVGSWQVAGDSWQVAQLSGGCKKVWNYVSPPAGSGEEGGNVTEQDQQEQQEEQEEQEEYSQHSMY